MLSWLNKKFLSLFCSNKSFSHTKQTAALPVFTLENSSTSESLCRIQTNDLEFRARVYGFSNQGEGVILVHGFPTSSMMWCPLAEALAKEGYKVVAYDQRGYSPGARPKEKSCYTNGHLVEDLEKIANAVGFKQFHLIGHDIGSVVSWDFAMNHSSRLKSLTILSIPHPGALIETVLHNPPLYIKLFSLPCLPEISLLHSKAKGLRKRYAPMSKEAKEEYLQIFTEPGALTATLSWYRMLLKSLERLEKINTEIITPTLFIYGKGEQWVNQNRLEYQKAQVKNAHTIVEMDIGGQGHRLIEHNPQVVISNALQHIKDYS